MAVYLKYFIKFIEKMKPSLIENQQQATLKAIEEKLFNIRLVLKLYTKKMKEKEHNTRFHDIHCFFFTCLILFRFWFLSNFV